MGAVCHVFAAAGRLWADAIGLHASAAPRDGMWLPSLLIVVVALLASYIGQSAVLVVNRLRGKALAFSLISSLVVLLVFAALAAGLIWLGALVVLGRDADVATLTRVVMISTAPLVFSFVTVIPLLGPILERGLQIWCLLVLWSQCQLLWQVSGWRLGLMLVLVVAVVLGLHALISPWFARLRDRLYHRILGRPLHASTAYLLELVEP